MKKLITTLIILTVTQLAIAQCSPDFTWSATPSGNNIYQVSFTNATPMNLLNNQANFNYTWGDGTASNFFTNTPNTVNVHNYTSPGYYLVSMVMNYYDSVNQTSCTATFEDSVYVFAPPCATLLSSSNNGQGLYTFEAITLAGPAGMSYQWNYGDGFTGGQSPVTHQYQSPGIYIVSLQAAGNGCTYFNSDTIVVTMPNSCSQANAQFSASFSNLTAGFYDASTQMPGWIKSCSWDFGDGTFGAGVNTNHTYASNGTYMAILTTTWTDSVTSGVVCSKADSQTFTLPIISFNNIHGTIVHDSSSALPKTFRVWLIIHDVANNTLTAIDSTDVTGTGGIPYTFHNIVGGDYLIKAALQNGPTSGTGEIPTYHTSSLYWYQATNVACSGVNIYNKDVFIQQGTVTSGPGFIGGNISTGANKGTSDGIPDIMIMLLNSSGQLVKFMYTDAQGDYAFDDLPLGTYTLFPEALNYLTTPMVIDITGNQPSSTGNNFGQTEDELKPKSTTGIANTSLENTFLVYPNPSQGRVVLQTTSAMTGITHIAVSDMTGRTVYTQSSNATKSIEMDLSQLSSGVYYIRIAATNGLQTEKLVIRH